MNAEKIIFSLCCAAVGAGLGCYGMSMYYKDLFNFCNTNKSLMEAYRLINEEYPFVYNDEYAEEYMINGLVEGLDDRFSIYNTSEENAENTVNFHPSSLQTGFQITRDKKTKCILISDVYEGSVAENCGLMTGDIIISINDISVSEKGFTEIAEELVGKDGKELNLTVLRNHENISLNLKLINDIQIGDRVELLDNNILYYYIDNFSSGGSKYYFNDEIKRLCGDDIPDKLIIDLRNNDGGNADAPVILFDDFDDDVNTVRLVSEKSGKEEVYSTSKPSIYNFDTVVLVSEKTMSSAETLTALFKDTGLGTIVGTQTGGKGVFQNVEWLPNKTTVTLVKGYYYVNHLPNYNGVGITPDVVVEMDLDKIGTDEDIQLQKAIEILSK